MNSLVLLDASTLLVVPNRPPCLITGEICPAATFFELLEASSKNAREVLGTFTFCSATSVVL